MRKAALALVLISALLVPTQASAATAKAGAKCSKLKATQIVGTKKFTCVKSGKKLVWDKGVTVPKVVVKKSQEIDFPEIGNRYLKESRIALTPGITTGGLPVSIVGTGACAYDVATSELVLNSLGTCSITASQAGNASFLPAASVTRTFEILKIAQVISAPAITEQDLLKVNSYNFDLPKVGSDAPFVVGTKDASICSVDGFKVNFLQAGTCLLTFNKGGDGFFEAAKEVTSTFKIFLSAQPGEKANPAPLGKEISKAGIAVTVDAITEEVSDDVCLADVANKGCVDKAGTGVFVSTDNNRYIEIVFTIINNSEKTWIASNIGVQFDTDRNYLSTTVYTIDSLDGLELEPGDGITGSYFVLVPNSAESAKALISYGDGNEATTFYFKAK
jgi:hypothetical protein